MADKKSSNGGTVQVVMSAKSYGVEKGAVVSVDEKQAKRLVDNGHATYKEKE